MFTIDTTGPAVPAGPGPASRRLCLWFIIIIILPPCPFEHYWYLLVFFLSLLFLHPPLLFLDLPLLPTFLTSSILFSSSCHSSISLSISASSALAASPLCSHLAHAASIFIWMSALEDIAGEWLWCGLWLLVREIFRPDDMLWKFLSTNHVTFLLASGFGLKGEILLYIIFVKFFSPIIQTFWFRSWHLPSHCTYYSSTGYTFCIYTYFQFQVFSIVPNFYMHSQLPFHMLSLFFPCALTLFTTFSELLWHFIFLWFILITFLTYPDAVYKPMYLLSSSSVCKLMLIHLLSYLLSKSSLYSQVSLFSLVTLLILW